jgi:hypothetical protein
MRQTLTIRRGLLVPALLVVVVMHAFAACSESTDAPDADADPECAKRGLGWTVCSSFSSSVYDSEAECPESGACGRCEQRTRCGETGWCYYTVGFCLACGCPDGAVECTGSNAGCFFAMCGKGTIYCRKLPVDSGSEDAAPDGAPDAPSDADGAM